ncbi:MAG: FtsX-like permease family protein [Chloroflexi bacterium]|nr:FtsX-like permease family protein [Chloroflexota bacterium]
MIRTRGRKILRDVITRKFRTLMVSTSIFVGVLGVIALFTTNDLLIRQLESDIKPENLAMIDVWVSLSSDAQPDNTTDLQTLNQQNELGQTLPQLDGIDVVEGVAIVPVGFKKPGQAEFDEGFIKSFSTPMQDRQLEPIRLLDGEWPVDGHQQIALEKRMADHYGFKVGDSIVFRGLSERGVSEIAYTVSALVYQANSESRYIGIFPVDSLYAQYVDAQALLKIKGYTNIRARYQNFDLAETHFEEFQRVIAENTSYTPVFALIEDPEQNSQVELTRNTGGVLVMLAVVAMVVAGFLVVNVINSIMVEQKRQIGVIKSLGGSRWDNFVIFTGIALCYGIIGTIPAVVLGIPLGFEMTKSMGITFDVLIQKFDWSPLAVLIGAVMGLVVPMLAAALPVFSGTRVSILNALTDFGISSRYGYRRMERWVGALPVPISVRQAVSSLTTKRSRLLLNLITLTLAVGAFMGVLAVTISLVTEVQALFDRVDYQVVVSPSTTYDQTWIQPRIAAIEGVQDVSPVADVSVTIEGNYTNFFTGNNQVEALGVDTRANMVHLTYSSGEGWEHDPDRQGVVIPSSMARQLGLKAGDDITFLIAGQRVTLPVLGVDRAVFDIMYLEWRQLAHLAGFTKMVDGVEVPVPNSYVVTMQQDHPSAADVDAVIDRLEISLMNDGVTAKFRNQITDSEQITDGINIFRNILLSAAVLIALVGAIGLLTTLSINVFERQKEIGVMRSIGASSSAIVSQFLSEGLIVGVAAWLIGIPLSYWLAITINAAMKFDTIEFHYRLIIPLLGMIGMIGIALLASIGPSLNAARKTVSNILRYQ